MHKKLLVICCTLLVFLSAVAFAQTEDISSPKLRISWEEFKKLHDKKGAVVVDVRGDEPFEQGHIPGSRSVPLEQVGKHAAELKKLNKPIVTYCA